ncbi:MAG: TonB-dependent receptor [Bacteroidales bacterium]|nr:TonB-dependent receptor [Bacteroidales bacterium]
MRELRLLLVFIFFQQAVAPAQRTYSMGGIVRDKATQYPLIGAYVSVPGSVPVIGTTSDARGYFRLMEIPLGRISIQVSYVGYHDAVLNDIIISSGIEAFLEVEMEEKVITTEEVIVREKIRKDQPLHKMAMISARSFSIEETYKYAGSFGDPARMAANFAGVLAPSLQRNDIIIRGNSPMGLLWRLDGIDIPNPNHFGTLGTTAGPVTILNNNVLTNSDFFTGAFPAEYGNALAGAFDLRMRTGNIFKRGYWGQIGWNGFEIGTEGYLKKNTRSSYLLAYRYSMLDLLGQIGLLDYKPRYQDLTFKVDIPTDKAGRFSLFGLWGKSYIDIFDSEKKQADWTYSNAGENITSGAEMGVVALSHHYFFNPHTSLRTVLSWQMSGNIGKTDTFSVDAPGLFTKNGENSTEDKWALSMTFRKKLNVKHTVDAGITGDLFFIDYNDSTFREDTYVSSTDIRDQLSVWSSYIQWHYRPTDKVGIYSGLRFQYLALNGSHTLEPRGGIKWQFKQNQSVSIGFGFHSQLQPKVIYFYRTELGDGRTIFTNHDLGFSRSIHGIAGYDKLVWKNSRIKSELYFQWLYDIPVRKSGFGQFSMLNAGDNFFLPLVDSLVNEGDGYNTGIELTLEKFFSRNYYWLVTLSVFDSKYRGADRVWRNTAFNGNVVLNILAGYEYPLTEKHILTLNAKIVIAGGKRYVPIDIEKSMEAGDEVYDWSRAYTKKYSNFLRFDCRLGYRANYKRFSQEIAFDIQNITSHKNILLQKFDPATGELKDVFQIGFFPMLTWKIEF